MAMELRERPFDPWRELADHQAAHMRDGAFGATAVFVGTMRDFAGDESVSGMFLEHYPGMTEREIERIVSECCASCDVMDMLVLHRVGRVEPGEPIVLVAIWSAHRAEAFTVCRAVMEALKSRAPFWKREETAGGGRWVAENTPGEPPTREQ
ncbi:MAG: molybdenum cofactor biosynthesis protein MoaE [Halofilum sp. (in: g-proteobacteria)]|nr:molybdenum cofactor biosynthesis protein MoaE [Halofilum sp. (in: g-proteobacteria)]